MDVKKLALLVGALVIAVVTAVMAKNMFAGAGAQQAAAAPAVPVGPEGAGRHARRCRSARSSTPTPRLQPWPKELIQSAYYIEGGRTATPQKLLGTVVRYPITAGQPVTHGSLVGPQDRGFLAAALGAGHARHHRSGERVDRRRRLRLPGRPCRPRADPGRRGRRRRSAAQGFRDDRPQHPRARDRPAHRPTRTRTARPWSRPSPT